MDNLWSTDLENLILLINHQQVFIKNLFMNSFLINIAQPIYSNNISSTYTDDIWAFKFFFHPFNLQIFCLINLTPNLLSALLNPK